MLHVHSTHMMMASALVLLLGSCKKEEDASGISGPSTTTSTISDYSLLDPGNYWVYDVFHVDSSGVVDASPFKRDSVYVNGDTTMMGSIWTRLGVEGDPLGIPAQLVRDSVDCLVDAWAGVQFCESTVDRIYRTDSYPGFLQLEHHVFGDLVPITVPAGTFLARMTTVTTTSLGAPVVPEHRNSRAYWKSGVGKLYQRAHYYANGEGIESRLVHYHVQ